MCRAAVAGRPSRLPFRRAWANPNTASSASTLSDYRDEAGLLKPHKVVTEILGQEMVMTFRSFLPNAEIDPAQFEVPPEVKALVLAL